MRFKACKEAGLKEVPIIVAENLTDEQQKEFIIKDNVSGGEWDWDMLANEWEVEQLDAWGLDIPINLEVELEAEEDDFEVPEGGIETDIVLGDLFEIGEHRLLCGDSTDSDQVAKLKNDNIIDLVFTDPPYGISVVQGSKVGGNKGFGSVGGGKIVKAKNYSEIIGDDTTQTAKEFYQTCISLGMENFIIWGGNYFTDFLTPSMCWIVWDKENTGNFADVELAWTSFDKAAKLYKWQWNGMIRKGDKNIEGKTRVHPTQKPVGLFGDIFNDFEFKICFDGFLGSGSTMVASHQLKRKCYGMELDPKYCQVIIDRMKKLDPTLIIKRNGIRQD
jgi:DNA modification methylase